MAGNLDHDVRFANATPTTPQPPQLLTQTTNLKVSKNAKTRNTPRVPIFLLVSNTKKESWPR